MKTIKLINFITFQTNIPRREAVQAIKDGAVWVNQKLVYDLTLDINPAKDHVKIKDQEIKFAKQKYYYKFYKPTNVICTLSDPEGRPCLKDYLQSMPTGMFPIGRLDRNTCGLLLFTNDGDFANKIMHPSFEIRKIYQVTLDKNITKTHMQRLLTGLMLDDGPVTFQDIAVIEKDKLEITLHEGRNRIIRRTFEHLGYTVKKLKRTAIGSILLGKLKEEQCQPFSKDELLSISTGKF